MRRTFRSAAASTNGTVRRQTPHQHPGGSVAIFRETIRFPELENRARDRQRSWQGPPNASGNDLPDCFFLVLWVSAGDNAMRKQNHNVDSVTISVTGLQAADWFGMVGGDVVAQRRLHATHPYLAKRATDPSWLEPLPVQSEGIALPGSGTSRRAAFADRNCPGRRMSRRRSLLRRLAGDPAGTRRAALTH